MSIVQRSLPLTYLHATAVPLLRAPGYWVPVVLFPSLLFSFFGVPPSQANPQIANILMASWSAFAVIGIGFFQFGVSIAQSRQEKWTDFVRTLPAGAGPKIAAQMGTAVLFLIMAVGLLWTLANFSTAVDLSLVQYARLAGALIVGVVPFVMLGIALGYALPARAAVPVANLMYLPLSYLGGLWMPPSMLPDIVQTLSPYVPTRQLGELVWAAVLDNPIPWSSVQGLSLYTLLFMAVAVIMWRRDDATRNR